MRRSPLALTVALVGSALLTTAASAQTTTPLPSAARYQAHIATTHITSSGVYIRSRGRIDYDYTIVWPGQRSFPDDYIVATGTTRNSRFITPGQPWLSDVPHPIQGAASMMQSAAWMGRDTFAGHCVIRAGAFMGQTSFEVVSTAEQRGVCAPALAHARADFAAVAPLIGMCQPSTLLHYAGCMVGRRSAFPF